MPSACFYPPYAAIALFRMHPVFLSRTAVGRDPFPQIDIVIACTGYADGASITAVDYRLCDAARTNDAMSLNQPLKSAYNADDREPLHFLQRPINEPAVSTHLLIIKFKENDDEHETFFLPVLWLSCYRLSARRRLR